MADALPQMVWSTLPDGFHDYYNLRWYEFTGEVAIRTSADGDDVTIDWEERGGPALEGDPSRAGFGTKLMELSLVNQLGGSFDRDWQPDGLAATITVQRQRIAGQA